MTERCDGTEYLLFEGVHHMKKNSHMVAWRVILTGKLFMTRKPPANAVEETWERCLHTTFTPHPANQR